MSDTLGNPMLEMRTYLLSRYNTLYRRSITVKGFDMAILKEIENAMKQAKVSSFDITLARETINTEEQDNPNLIQNTSSKKYEYFIAYSILKNERVVAIGNIQVDGTIKIKTKELDQIKHNILKKQQVVGGDCIITSITLLN